MNQHSIPIGVHRKLGLDNIEPSGLEGDRPVAAENKEAAEEGREEVGLFSPEDLEVANEVFYIKCLVKSLSERLDSQLSYQFADQDKWGRVPLLLNSDGIDTTMGLVNFAETLLSRLSARLSNTGDLL
jgi:hypothetical protein